MHNFYKHISCLILLLSSVFLYGQGLPSLGIAKEISKGRLPNGIEYYLVTNPSDKGFADYALVRMGGDDADEDRKSLENLEHFGSRKAYRFLAENGVAYSSFGLISRAKDASILSLRNVPVHNQTVADSTLLMVMDVASKHNTSQAIVISGDINVSKIKERMELLSMTVSRLGEYKTTDEYQWEAKDSLRLVLSRNLSSDLAMIRLIYSTERLSRDKLDSPQPLLTYSYAKILADIFERRVTAAFEKAGIPLAMVDTRYQDCSQGAEDERYYFSVYTSASRLEDATSELAAVLSSLDNFGSDESEFGAAKSRLKEMASRMSGIRYLSNKEYVDKCVSSYLYGTDLAAPSTTYGFMAGNNLPVAQELPLFNSFASALLDPEANAVLRFDLPDVNVDVEELKALFDKSWKDAAARKPAQRKKASSSIPLTRTAEKLRIKRENADPISGGKLITFNNGFRVICRNIPLDGEIYYALMLRGGVAGVPELSDGEAAFVGDMLAVSDVAGMSGREFRSRLESRGITMNTSASVSDLRITGSAPSGELTLLLNALQSLANKRSVNEEEFRKYKGEEALRLELKAMQTRDFNPIMDSIMRPQYAYSHPKNISRLRNDFPYRTEQYFESLFSKVNDGLLVIVGDFDEEELKKELCRLLGGFRVQTKFVQRQNVSARLALSSSSKSELSRPGLVGASEIGVNVALSAAAPFNIKNYMTFKIAARGIELALIRELADMGATVNVLCRNEAYPAERISLFIKCQASMESGLPAGISAASPDKILAGVRNVLSDIQNISLDDKDMKACKTRLISEYESSLANPEGIIDAVLIRYSDGRDVVSGYKEAINSVSKDDIREVLTLLDSGADVEYTIY